MAQLYASVAIGTASTLLATILLLLRAKFRGRRPAEVLAQRWIAMSTHTSGFAVAVLAAIAVASFASIPTDERGNSSGVSDQSVHATARHASGMASQSDEGSGAAQDLEALLAYADKVDAEPHSTAAASRVPGSVELPDVETMIAELFARLEKQPDDVKGWKMLAWSYLNTDRPEEAARAYEAALKLEPGDVEIMKGLEQAKSVRSAAGRTPSPSPATSPTAEDVKATEDLSGPERDSMIRGMVDRLAARLETSPNDEDGWLRLMRSRITLGEKEAAKAALAKALEAFASDAAAKDRLTAAARELGVETN